MVMGSRNPKYCVLVNLAIYLEKWLREDGSTSQWLFADGVTDRTSPEAEQDKETTRCKTLYARTLKAVLDDINFERSPMSGKLGTHSIRKYSATVARKSGVSKDNLDYRARWKSKRMQDNYVGMELAWPDITTASKLCKGGFVVYRQKNGLNISDDWISRFVAPSITSSFDEGVGAVLGRALLWAVMDPEYCEVVSSDIRREVTGAFIRLETDLVDGDNPIEKLEVIPSESQGIVNLDVVPSGEQADFDAARGIGGTNSNAANIQWRNVIYAKLQSTQETVRDLQNHQVAKMAMMDTRVRHIESMTRQLSISPARLLGIVGERGTTRNEETRRRLFRAGTAAPGKAAVLGMPKTLSTLWDEYVNGSCGGGKPAHEFVS